MNLYHSNLFVTLQLFYSLRHWLQTSQPNCGTQGEHDLSFGRRYLRFTSASTIPRAFEFNGAGKHLNPKLQIKWYNSIRFDHSVFLGKKSSHPFVKWSPPKILCFTTVFYPTNFPTYWDSKVEKLQAAETVICGPLAHSASLPIF